MSNKHFPGWFKLASIFTFLILCGIFIVHLVINSAAVQDEIKTFLKDKYDIHLTWDELLFNGATGRFSGNQITIRIPKSQTSIILNKFSLIFNPLKIPLQQIDLIELNAENIIIEQNPNSTIKKTSQALTLPTQKVKKAENLASILKHFHIRKGNIKNIQVSIIDKLELSIKQLDLKAKNPFLFYREAGDIIIKDIHLISPKFDLFADGFTMTGSYSFFSDDDFFYPQGDGVIRGDNILLGINKKPLDWNPHPGFSDKLEPSLKNIYGNDIPTNRTFAHLNEVTLPLKLDLDILEIINARIQAFEGILKLDAKWERQSGPFSLKFNTSIPASLDLLPLGKARIRDSFEKFSFDMNVNGNLQNFKQNDLQGYLKINLIENNHVPEFSHLKLLSSIDLKNGILNLKDLTAKLKEGIVTAKTKIDLHQLKISSLVEVKKVNLQTIVRLFSTIDIPGTVDGEGTISGDILNPKFDLNLKAKDFGYESLHLGSIQGKLKIIDQNLDLKGSSSLGSNGKGQWHLDIKEVFRSSLQTLRLSIDVDRLPIDQMLQSEVIQGNFSGNIKFKKNLGDYEGSGILKTKNIKWYNIPIQKTEVSLKIDDRNLYLQPQEIIFNENYKISKNIPPTHIKFTPYQGYEIDGWILPQTSFKAKFNELISNKLFLVFEANKENLIFLDPWFKEDFSTFETTGTLNLEYFFEKPESSIFGIYLKNLKAFSPQKQLSITEPTSIKSWDQIIEFHQSHIYLGQYSLFLDGIYSFNHEKPVSNLTAQGKIDLDQLDDIFDWLNDSSGIVDVNLILKGSHEQPLLYGDIKFNQNQISLSSLKADLNSLKGKITLNGYQYHFHNLEGIFDDAKFFIDGWIKSEDFQSITNADLKFKANEITLNKHESWNLLADADLSLQGNKNENNPITLKGQLAIVEGIYFKNYESTDFLLKPVGVVYEEEQSIIPELFKNINVDLNAKTSGEIEVKNNIANLILTCDLNLSGPIEDPLAQGSINIVDGEINALGISFNNANGFVSYEQNPLTNPYIDFEATRDIQDYEIKTEISGYASNLKLSFNSTPSLAQNDIISLVAFGRTPDQLTDDKQRVFSRAAVASQILGFIGKPLSKATKLDIVKLKTEDNRNLGETASTFAIGKTLSPRFSLSLITDIGDTDAISGLSFEYLLLDDLLIKGTKDTGSRYRFDLTWRFIGY